MLGPGARQGRAVDEQGLGVALLHAHRRLDDRFDGRLVVGALVEHVGAAVRARPHRGIRVLLGRDQLGEDEEQLIGVDRADGEIVVGVLAAVEVEAAQPALIEQDGDDMLDVGALGMVAGIDQHLGLGPSFWHSSRAEPQSWMSVW